MTSLRLRVTRRIRPGSLKQIARTPSHLISNAQRSGSGGSAADDRASIGTTRSGMGSASGSAGGSMRWIIQVSLSSSGLEIVKSA